MRATANLIIASTISLISLTFSSKIQAVNSSEQLAFLAAEKAFANGDLTNYRKLKNSLKDYPLYPYLEYKELLKKLDVQNRAEIDSFIVTYNDSPLADRLKQQFINQLAAKKQYDVLEQYYNYGDSASLDCQILSHKLKKR